MESRRAQRVLSASSVLFTLRLCAFIYGLRVMVHSVQGLPPGRRYDPYNTDEDIAPIRPSPHVSGFGPSFAAPAGYRSVSEHASWCPLRRPNRPTQRLPIMGRPQGPNYYNYPLDDDDCASRYVRPQRGTPNARPVSSNFHNADISEVSSSGTNVGGIFWPRRSPWLRFDDESLTSLSAQDGDQSNCNHFRVATLAKDATAAAADAATAAAAAARAAAAAAAAAACSPDAAKEDHSEIDDADGEDDSDENADLDAANTRDDFRNDRDVDSAKSVTLQGKEEEDSRDQPKQASTLKDERNSTKTPKDVADDRIRESGDSTQKVLLTNSQSRDSNGSRKVRSSLVDESSVFV